MSNGDPTKEIDAMIDDMQSKRREAFAAPQKPPFGDDQ
jgi:hypothetical protein